MEIYENNPDLDYLELFNIEEYTERLKNSPGDFFTHYMELRDAVNRLKAMKFDMVVNATHDRFSTFLTHLIASPDIKGMYLLPNKKLQIHIHGFWFRYLRCTSEFRMISSFNLADIYKNAVGGAEDTRQLFFHLQAHSLSEADRLLNNGHPYTSEDTYIGFQLGTSTGNRRWPTKYFAALGNLLQRENNTTVVLLGSKNEKELGERVTGQMAKRPINLIGKTNISILSAVLNRCAMLITNDTGTMHLAEAVGTRCIALFFESANPFQTGPYGTDHIICFPDMGCFPCATTFQCQNKRCLECISAETVHDLIQHTLNARTSETIPQPNGVRVYRTRFNKWGVWDAWPLGKTELKKNDLLRRIYRNMWFRYAVASEELKTISNDDFIQTDLVEEWNKWAQHHFLKDAAIQQWFMDFRRNLDMLEQEIDAGLTIIKEIVSAGENRSFDGLLLGNKSDEIGRIDQKIIHSGKCAPWLSQLTNLFELELAQIQDTNFYMMVNEWKRTYDGLTLQLNLLRDEIQITQEIFSV